MASYIKSASFSNVELNSGTNLNITNMTVNDVISSAKLTSSLIFSIDSPSSVTFAISDGSLELGNVAFTVVLNSIKLNESEFTINASYNARDIVYGNNNYVIALYNTDQYALSSGGTSFSTGDVYQSWFWTDTVYPQSIMYGNGRFVMHSGRYCYDSSNGSSWSRTSLSGGSNSWRAGPSLYGNGTFVITVNNNAHIFYSTNGTSWTRVSATAYTYIGAAYGAGKFVFLTADGNICYSTNGSSWSTTNIGNGSNWGALCFGNNKFVAISTTGAIAISTDGTSWTYYENKLNARSWVSVDYGNEKYVVIASSSNIVAVSYDGITWYETTLGSTNKAWSKIKFCNNIFWALSNSSNSGYKLNPDLTFKFDPTENTIAINNHALKNDTLTLSYNSIPSVKSGSLNVDLEMTQSNTYTLTQKYYIKDTTISIQADTITQVEKGSSWAFGSYPNTINYNGREYKYSSVSGDPASGSSIDSDKERIIYYTKILYNFTLTQKYYIKDTTTSIQSDTVKIVTEGNNWAFDEYPSIINYNGREYEYNSISGDSASGTNIDSNKERIIYYTKKLYTYTLTQKYYIEGTTTSIQANTITEATEGSSWSFGSYPSSITYNGREYDFVSISGESSGTNLDGNKERIVYYTKRLYTYTLTQKYYIESTTTPIKSDTIIQVTEGSSWEFGDYPSSIIYNDEEYKYSSISGDSASGTNIDSNKERIIYYTKKPTYTLTQKYYIEGTTTPIQSETVKTVVEGNNWAFDNYPDTIEYDNHIYEFKSIIGDSSSGTNINSNKSRIIYYTKIPNVYTLTQKYYIDGTTTSIQSDTVTEVTEGSSWEFGSYPNIITYNDEKYLFSSISGDDSSGTNLDSNKERIIYYTKRKSYTLTQKYYIEGTTTSIKDDTVDIVIEGYDWSFSNYPTVIYYNDETYSISSVTGDSASGTNIDSNKERIIYYIKKILPVYTLTHKYYIEGSTTSIKDTFVKNVVEGDNWEFDPYPNIITYNSEDYVFSYLTGDPSSGANINSNKERIFYYIKKPTEYTLIQKYYIDGTTTSIKTNTVKNVVEGSDWRFDSYPSTIVYNGETYEYKSVTGDNVSGTNITSNKERIVYYIKKLTPGQKFDYNVVTFPMSVSMISSLANDINMCYIKKYKLNYTDFNSSTSILFSNLISGHKIFKIKVIYKNPNANIIEFSIEGNKFILSNASNISTIDCDIEIVNDHIELVHSNNSMTSGTFEVHLYCRP